MALILAIHFNEVGEVKQARIHNSNRITRYSLVQNTESMFIIVRQIFS